MIMIQWYKNIASKIKKNIIIVKKICPIRVHPHPNQQCTKPNTVVQLRAGFLLKFFYKIFIINILNKWLVSWSTFCRHQSP
jgi:hypothetical protein